MPTKERYWKNLEYYKQHDKKPHRLKYFADRREKRVAEGKCMICGRPRLEDAPSKRCILCADYNLEHAATRRNFF